MRSHFATAVDAETAFYHAFAARDLNAMMAVWAPGDDIACIHPFGTRLIGQATVRGSWETIFAQTASLSFRIGEVQVFALDALSVHVVHEHIHVGAHAQSEPPLIATNVYRLIDASWRMVLHHASPTPSPKRGEGATRVWH